MIIAPRGQLLAAHLIQGALDHVYQLLFLLLLAAQGIQVLGLPAIRGKIYKYINYFRNFKIFLPLTILVGLNAIGCVAAIGNDAAIGHWRAAIYMLDHL